MVIVVLQAGGAQLTVLLREGVGEGPSPLARACGYEWSYLERHPQRPLIELLARLNTAAPTLPASATLADVLRACEAELQRYLADARLTFLRAVDSAQVIPWWPMSLRNGPLTGSALWPSDVELLGLRLGLRTLIKRENADSAEAERSQRWLASQGLSVSRGGRDGNVVFAAIAEAEVAVALDVERAMELGGAAGDAASRALGHSLGYPSCCVEAFLRLGRRDDRSLYATRLPPLGSEPAPPESLWLPVPLRLLSYTPCTPDCAATVALGWRLLAALDDAAPGYRQRWHAAAARVHLVTGDGRVFSVAAEGALDGARITHAQQYVAPVDLEALPEVLQVESLVGQSLRVDGDTLVAGPHRAVLAADHRGR